MEAVCQPVKDAVTSDLNCCQVKKIAGYQRVGQAVAKNITASLELEKSNLMIEEGNISKAHIQEKKAKNKTYKKGNGEITLDELFLIQNGENHG